MTIEDVFSPFGVLSRTLERWSYREDQEKMAALVEKAFTEGRHAVVEAGTGIGKSFAYLLPAFLLLEKDEDAVVVVATSTIPLQKQLYEKDVPFLEKALDMHPDMAILYGRSNYICMRKYMEMELASALLSVDPKSPEGKLRAWVKKTGSGSRSDITDKAAAAAAVNLGSDENDCMGRRCPYIDKCFFYRARKKAQSARLIITNHHIVLSDSQIRWENKEDFSSPVILPGYTHLVLDEAHHVEDEATDAFSEKYNRDNLAFFIDALSRKNESYGGASLIEHLSVFEEEGKKGDEEKGKRYRRAEKMLSSLSGEAEAYSLVLRTLFDGTAGRRRDMLLTPDFYGAFRGELRKGEALAESMANASVYISSLWDREREGDESVLIQRALRYADGIMYLSEVLRSFIRLTDFDSFIPYTERGTDGEWTVKIAPMETGRVLASRLVEKLRSILFCSATLSVGGSFRYFSERSGLTAAPGTLEGIYPSPFDYQRQLMYLVPQDAKEWKMDDKGYTDYVSSQVSAAIRASGGGALVLFTSISMMDEVYRNVREEIGDELELLVQDGRTSRHILLSRFRERTDSSLFATSSFWEGVDAPGETLRLVIITKLPFTVPTDPVNMARAAFIDKDGNRRSFMSMTVPQSVIRMKQGVGRLIRNEGDKGIVMICDGRIIRKSYSRVMFSSLPEGYIPEDTLVENIPGKIERFLF